MPPCQPQPPSHHRAPCVLRSYRTLVALLMKEDDVTLCFWKCRSDSILGVISYGAVDVRADATTWRCCCGQNSGCHMPVALVLVKVMGCCGCSLRHM
eukprot:5271359-Pleurochrysis_carterae.AAC.2